MNEKEMTKMHPEQSFDNTLSYRLGKELHYVFNVFLILLLSEGSLSSNFRNKSLIFFLKLKHALGNLWCVVWILFY